MKLGIIVVYLVEPGNEALLRLHLDQIASCTVGAYQIYGAANRLAPPLRPLLERPDVSCLSFAETPWRGAAEHSYYLDLLVQAALADGATHLCMLHVDSFPVARGWDARLAAALAQGNCMAGILRVEHPRELIPSTAGLFFAADFYRGNAPLPAHPFQPADAQFEAFRRRRGCHDSAEPYGYWAWRQRLPWLRLRRSNAVNDHPFLAGVYGDVIFHLGGHLRQGAWSILDDWSHGGERRRQALRRLLPGPLASLPAPASFRALLRRGKQQRMQENTDAFARIRERLLADPGGYLDYLRGRNHTEEDV